MRKTRKIDSVKLQLYKQARLQGKNKAHSLIAAGYTPKSALHQQNVIPLAKFGDREIAQEMETSGITVERVRNGLLREALTAIKASDRVAAWSWLGKYLAMFTDKHEISGFLLFTDEEKTETNRIKSLYQLQ